MDKLFPPQVRDLSRARTFWKCVVQSGEVEWRCIYSEQTLHAEKLSLDHFLPWSFVTHDLLWNLIPTPRSVNSAKSDRLPSLETYLDRFCEQQYKAVQIVGERGKEKQLDDYTLLFHCEPKTLLSMSQGSFAKVLRETITPQWQIAKNMGFQPGWSYGKITLS